MSDQNITTERLRTLFLNFVLPAVISMVLAGMQSMIDGVFLGKYAGSNAMASVNIAIPYMQMIMGCTMIICSGTISFLGRTLGEGSKASEEKAGNIFFSSVLALGILSLILLMLGAVGSRQLAVWMGANEVLMKETAAYIRCLSFFTPAVSMMILFGFTDRLLGKPHLYLLATIVCLVSNIIMDFAAIRILKLGAAGAALATGCSYAAGLMVTIRPVLNRNSAVHVYRGKFHAGLLKHTILNGSSEGVTSLATAVTVWLFNMALMQYAGEDGVASFTVINYISNFAILIMFGVADGTSTLISYHYGAGSYERMMRILKLALLFNLLSGLFIFLLLNCFSVQMIQLFLTAKPLLVEMTVQGARLYSIAFLMNGFNIMQSGFQTALGHAGRSALIAGSRGLIFIFLGIQILPLILGINGVWLTVPFAEGCTLLLCLLIGWKGNYRSLSS